MQCEWRSGFQTSASPKQQCVCQVPKKGDIGRAITLTVYHINSWRQCACPMQLLLGDELCPVPSSCIPSLYTPSHLHCDGPDLVPSSWEGLPA